MNLFNENAYFDRYPSYMYWCVKMFFWIKYHVSIHTRIAFPPKNIVGSPFIQPITVQGLHVLTIDEHMISWRINIKLGVEAQNGYLAICLVLWIRAQVPVPICTYWSQVMHICVSKLTIIGSDNGLSPCRHQPIIWTSAGILLVGSRGTNLTDILIDIQTFSLRKMHLKI